MDQDNKEYEERIAELARIYPDLSRDDLEEVEFNLREYFRLLVKIMERIKRETGSYPKFDDDTENGKDPA